MVTRPDRYHVSSPLPPKPGPILPIADRARTARPTSLPSSWRKPGTEKPNDSDAVVPALSPPKIILGADHGSADPRGRLPALRRPQPRSTRACRDIGGVRWSAHSRAYDLSRSATSPGTSVRPSTAHHAPPRRLTDPPPHLVLHGMSVPRATLMWRVGPGDADPSQRVGARRHTVPAFCLRQAAGACADSPGTRACRRCGWSDRGKMLRSTAPRRLPGHAALHSR